jgi:hypothetical protein
MGEKPQCWKCKSMNVRIDSNLKYWWVFCEDCGETGIQKQISKIPLPIEDEEKLNACD